MKLCEEEFLWQLKVHVMQKLPAYQVIKNAMLNRVLFHPSKEIIYLENRLCPWKEYIYGLERKEGCEG